MTTHEQDALRVCEQIIERVGDRAEAQVRTIRRHHGLTRFANSAIHQHVGEQIADVSLTVAIDGRVASASTANLADDALDDFVEATLDLARVQPVDPAWPGLTAPTETPDPGHLDVATAGALPVQRAELVREFVDAGPELRAAGYVDSEGVWAAFANSAGHTATGANSRATVDGIHQTGTSAGAGHQTSVRIADLDAARTGMTAAQRARDSATFTDVPPGAYEVVLGPEAVATIAIFLAFYGYNAKSWLEGQSFVELGERQLDPAITLVDDATDPRTLGLGFDAEGTPKARTVLIDEGVSRSLAHDRRTAARFEDGARSTGHAVPGGASMGAIPTDLIVEPGGSRPADLVAGVQRGLLVTQFHYCRVLDPRSQVVTGLTRNGTFLIEDGEIAGAVGNLRFTQSFLEALGEGRVLGVGDDLRHADSEFGTGMVMAPSVRLASWNFSGGAQG